MARSRLCGQSWPRSERLTSRKSWSFNKADRAPDAAAELASRYPGAVVISAATGEGIEGLLAVIAHGLRAGAHVVELSVPYSRGDVLAALHREGEVLSTVEEEESTTVRARLSVAVLAQFTPWMKARTDRLPHAPQPYLGDWARRAGPMSQGWTSQGWTSQGWTSQGWMSWTRERLTRERWSPDEFGNRRGRYNRTNRVSAAALPLRTARRRSGPRRPLCPVGWSTCLSAAPATRPAQPCLPHLPPPTKEAPPAAIPRPLVLRPPARQPLTGWPAASM